MNSRKILRIFTIFALLLSNVGCDQISKKIIRNNVDYFEQIELISNRFTLTKVENTGAFLSMGDSLPDPIKLIVLNILPLIALFAGIIFLLAKHNLPKISAIGLCFIIGGGIGNIYDRIMYGSVTDFFHIDFVIFQTGIFNMADVSIMVGMFLIVVQSFKQKEATLSKEDNEVD